MIQRLCKVALVASVALFFTLVAFGNVIDYGSNWAFVQHVLSMDTTFRDPDLMWRAVTDPAAHRAAYVAIIAWQGATALVCWVGALRLLAAAGAASGRAFNRAKGVAVAGLTMGLLLYVVGFLVIAGEWFAMWQSETWNGQDAASRFLVFIGVVLIFLSFRDDDLEQDATH